MNKFEFKTDDKMEKYCIEIAETMVRLFNISIEEAFGRINNHWRGQELVGYECLVMHEDEEYWANTIYYTEDSFWWMPEQKDSLKVRKYNNQQI